MSARLSTAALALCFPIILGGCQLLSPIADDADSGTFDPRAVMAASFLIGGGLLLKSSGSEPSAFPTIIDDDDGDSEIIPPMPIGLSCSRCGEGTSQVNYEAGTSLATYTFDSTAGTETNRVDLATTPNVRRDATAIRTILPAELSDGNSANGEIPMLNVDAYADAAQATLAVVFEMQYGALGLWVRNPGAFFLGGETDYLSADFRNSADDSLSGVRFAHFGEETPVADLPTGTATFDGVINAISHTEGRRTPSEESYIPPNAIFVASEAFSMTVNFQTRDITAPDQRLYFDRQYIGPGGAAEAFRMLADNPGALLGGKNYVDDASIGTIGFGFRTGGAATIENLPSSVLFNGNAASGHGIDATNGNLFQLELTRNTPDNRCCHGIFAPIMINGKFYGPNAEEAIGAGRGDTTNAGGEFILGIFTRKRQ